MFQSEKNKLKALKPLICNCLKVKTNWQELIFSEE